MEWTKITPQKVWSSTYDDSIEYMTLYELAESIYVQYNVSNGTKLDESYIQTEAIPALVGFLFNGLPYDATKKDVWEYFIKEFMSRFLNREICSKDAKVFRSKLIYPLTMYKTFIENADDMWDDINSTLSDIKEKTSSTGSKNNNKTLEKTRENSGNNNREYSSSKNLKSTASNELTTSINESVENNDNSTNTIEYNSTDAINGSNSSESNNSSTSSDNATSNNRVVNSDYPQSVVNATTIGNPSLQSWTYASGAQDSNNNTTNTNTSSGTDSNSGNHSETTKYTGSDKTTNVLSSKHSKASNSTNTESINKTDTDTISDTDKTATTFNETENATDNQTESTSDNSETTRQTMSDFELKLEKIKFWESHPLKCVAKLLEHLEQYFMSEYVDEERDGYMTWECYINIAKYFN